jgi:hypothetical protein
MRTRLFAVALPAFLVGLLAAPAHAQFGAVRASNPPPGETYRLEVSGGLWNPTPALIVSSEQLGIVGTDIDFLADLGIEKKRFRQLDVVIKAARKHKFRFSYTPLEWQGDTILTRDLVFNAIRYRVSLPVQSRLQWKQYRFGYEWDFVSNDRGFAGLLLDVKYTDLAAELSSEFVGTEFTSAKAPVPAIGGIVRVYATPNASGTFELTGLKVPRIDDKYEATWIDWDLYGTYDVTRNFGVRFGYKVISLDYLVEEDTGDLDLKGLYFAGVLRF